MNPSDASQPSSASEPQGKHRTGLFTLLFTDVVGSTQLKAALGDQSGVTLIQSHHALVRELLRSFPEAEEISTAGDSFLLVFGRPSDALRFALQLQRRLRDFNLGEAVAVEDRLGLHMGEVVIEQREGKRDVHGMQVDTCARVMSLAQAGQILMTRPVFDNARQSLKGEEIEGIAEVKWLNHGRFELKGLGEPVEVCEVRAGEAVNLTAPTTSEKARRVEAAEGEAVLGWRPAVGQVVPNTKWVLEQKLGEGGFGEVWLGQHQTMKERRVFKFCFRADRVRSLKREMTLFRLIKERIGDHPNIVSLREVYFDQPPFYVEEDYVPGQDLASWCATQGGVAKVPVESKLEIVAQIADGLQAAHDAGVIHRDVKPGNILVSVPKGESQRKDPRAGDANSRPVAKLTDFGIGQVISEEALAGVTRAGFTQTMLSTSSSQTGTHLYMAPELLAGKPASIRSDIYSLGVVLWQLLLGDLSRPLPTDWGEEIADPLLREDLQHCFAGDPRNRFPGARQLANNLRNLRERKRRHEENFALARRARQRHRLAVVSSGVTAVLLLVAAALGYGLWQSKRARDLAEAHTYAADMNVAQQALLNEDLGKARSLLARYAKGTGREHLRGFEWRYLTMETRTDELATDSSGREAVFRVALSPDGRTLAVGRGPGTIELRDPLSLSLLATLETNALGGDLAFAPSGDRLLAAGPNGLRFWQLSPPRVLGELVSSNITTCLSFSPDGRQVASFQMWAGVMIWDCETLKMVKHLPNFSSMGVHGGDVCFSPDGRYLAVGDRTGRIRLLSWPLCETVADIPAFEQPVMCLAFSPDASLLASGSGYSPSDIRLWDPKSGKLVGSLPGHRAWITMLQFIEGGRRLVSTSADQTTRVWDISSRRLLATLRGHQDEVWSLAMAGTNTLITGCKDGALARWDVQAARQRSTHYELPGETLLPVFVDNSSLAVLSSTGSVCLWNPTRPQEFSPIVALGTSNVDLASAPLRKLLATSSREGPVRIWSPHSGCAVTNLGGQHSPVTILTFARNGDWLVVAGSKGGVTIWSARNWSPRCSFTETNELSCVAFSPDARLLALGAFGGQVIWRDAVDGRLLSQTFGHRKQRVAGVDFSPDGRLLASACEDGTLALWDTATRQRVAHWKAHFLGVHGVAFSPDGTRLATGLSGGYAVRVWDTKTWRELITLAVPRNLFYELGFSPDGAALYCGSNDGHTYLWAPPPFEQLDAAQ